MRVANTCKSSFRRRAFTAIIVIVAILAGALAPILGPAATTADAAVASDFDPGNIISDAIFYDSSALNANQVQGFLNSHEPTCQSGYTCLDSYTQSTPNEPASAYCSAYTGVANQSAAQIITSVALACGINPAVLIVLLQKEQGLVTATAPTALAYQGATGFGCPDTAPCASAYYGFFNQVYLASQQYKIYQAKPNSFGYRAGRANTILYNPNSACGSSSVYIDNQATAGLYDYTPYRPDQAALSNLYGNGDGCSTYGNRNFWRYFTDWFGNPQGGGSFVRTASDPTIYLLAGTTKYPVPNLNVYTSLAVLGPYRVVSDDYLANFTLGPAAGNFLRDPTSGYIYLAGDGVKDQFTTCDQFADYDGACVATAGEQPYIDVDPSQLALFSTGPVVTSFARSSDTGQIYYVTGGTKDGVHSFAKIAQLAGGGPQTWTNHTDATLSSIPTGVDYLDPAAYVTSPANTPNTYLLDGASTFVPVPSATIASEFGISGIENVSDQTISAGTVAPAPLSLAVSCGGVSYVAGAGQLWPVASTGGLTVTSLASSTCAALPISRTSDTGALFYRVASSGYIYYISGGQKHFVHSMTSVYALNGSVPLVLVPISQASADTIPTGADVLTVTSLVKTASAVTVYFVDGTSSLIPITSFALAAEFGVSGYSVVDNSTLSVYTPVSAPLSLAVSCGGVSYVAGAGQLWPVASTGGLTVTSLASSTCAALPISRTSDTGALFYRVASSGYIYYISGGQKHFVHSMTSVYALNGSVPLVLVPISQASADTIPTGADVLTVTSLVKTASAVTVYFVDGTSSLIPITSFALAAEFGVSGYSVVDNSTLSVYTPVSAPLSLAVSCGGVSYVAGAGQLWPVASTGGLTVTSLASSTCAALPISRTSDTGALFYRVASSGYIYYISGGQKHFVHSMTSVYALNGSVPLVLVPISQASADTIPTGADVS